MRYGFALIVLVLVLARTASVFALDLTRVTDGVWAIVGPMEQRNPQNLANNATFGVVLTDTGAVLIDPGGSYKGAAEIDKLVKSITNLPISHVINTGGQDHRWLGNSFFKERGAVIIASNAAVEDQRARVDDQFFNLTNLIGKDALAGTVDVYAETTFEHALDLTIGGVRLELRHVATAHTPGDAFVWLPDKGVMFSGDIIYVGRMLGVFPSSSSSGWLDAFIAIEALKPAYIVPGHGPVTDLARARAETRDYLSFLRREIGKVIENGGDVVEATAIDQSAFAHLEVYAQIKGRNAQQVFQQMEWE
jgi:glyoxylase-like metal-dependent hydrolase (beta-lactamase superfamily II)